MREWLSDKLDAYLEARRRRSVAITCQCGAEYTMRDEEDEELTHWCDLKAVEDMYGEWRSNVRAGGWTEHRACEECYATLKLPIVIREGVMSLRWLALRMLGRMAVERLRRVVS